MTILQKLQVRQTERDPRNDQQAFGQRRQI